MVRGSDRGPVRIQLEPWGSVTGRLVKPDGEPMANVWVNIGYVPRVRAGKDGTFRFDGLARGLKYSVSVVAISAPLYLSLRGFSRSSGPASALVAVSRAIDYAYRARGGDWRTAAGAEAARLRDEIWAVSGW